MSVVQKLDNGCMLHHNVLTTSHWDCMYALKNNHPRLFITPPHVKIGPDKNNVHSLIDACGLIPTAGR